MRLLTYIVLRVARRDFRRTETVFQFLTRLPLDTLCLLHLAVVDRTHVPIGIRHERVLLSARHGAIGHIHEFHLLLGSRGYDVLSHLPLGLTLTTFLI